MKRFLILLALVGCEEPAVSPTPPAVESLSKSYPLTRDELKFLVSTGNGHDYVKLTTRQREYFGEFLKNLMTASTSPKEIQHYLDGIYDGSQPAIMNQRINEVAAAAVTMIEGIDAANKQ